MKSSKKSTSKTGSTNTVKASGKTKAQAGKLTAKAVKPLTKTEKKVLQAAEEAIKQGNLGSVEIGLALQSIQSNNLYRAGGRSFPLYCRERWNLGEKYAYRLIGAAQVFEKLKSSGVKPLPLNEAQIRTLVPFGKKFAASLWKEVLKQTDNKPTAAEVKSALAGFALVKGKIKKVKLKPKSKPTKRSSKTKRLVTRTLKQFEHLSLAKIKKALEDIKTSLR